MKQPALVITSPPMWNFGEMLTNGGSYNNYIRAAGDGLIPLDAARAAIYLEVITDLYKQNYLTAESYMELVERLK